jgi:hypothetical protein
VAKLAVRVSRAFERCASRLEPMLEVVPNSAGAGVAKAGSPEARSECDS